MKDANYPFEKYRNKFIHNFAFCSLLQGPFLSQDRSRIIYLQYDDMEPDTESRKSVLVPKMDSESRIVFSEEEEVKRID